MASNTYGAIKLSTAERVGAVLKKKTGSADGYKPKEWADTINLLGLLPIRTASGTIAHFEDGADSVPMKSVVANIVPIQSGTGTPSPSNPRPISGTSVLNVEKRGKNLIKEEITVQNRYILANGSTAYNGTWGIVHVNIKGGENYTISGINYPDTGTYFAWYDGNLTLVSVIGSHKNYTNITAPNNAKILGMSFLMSPNNARYDLNTAQLELGSTATTYEPYNAETYTIDLGQEIMGGTADIVGGVGESTQGYGKITDLATNYFYSTANKRWEVSGIPNLKSFPSRSIEGLLSDIWQPDVGAYTGDEGKFFTVNGVVYFYTSNSDTLDGNIVYPLATPTEYTFTGQPINSYLGVNNVWTDSGEVLDVEYRADMNLLIAELGG